MKPGEKEKLAAAIWWKQFKETNNDTFLPLLWDTHRFLILKGGGGSGKSIFAGRKLLERASTEPGHRVLVCRKVGRTLRHSCFEQLVDQCYEFYAEEVEAVLHGDMEIRFRNGSRIFFSGLDDVEKLKSIFDITMIWVEEASEITEADFNQLDIRLRTKFPFYLQMILTFNPIAITHWLKKRFFDRQDEDARVHESTYKDNRFLIEVARRRLEAFKDTDEYYYMVYCLGQWGVTGKTIFAAKLVAERLSVVQKRKPVRRGYFAYEETPDRISIRNITWVEDEQGPIRIYEEPKAGTPYVAGGDTAGEGSDWFIGQMIDNVTGHQVAVLRHQYEEDTYAKQMYCLGLHYNKALLGIETNYSTYPTKLLGLMQYPNLYVRDIEDSYDGRMKHAFGFQTNSLTRPLLIAQLVQFLRDNMDAIEDEDTLLEMLTFVRNEKLRPEAEAGAHDDCIMALGIAHYIRPQQTKGDRAEKEKAKNKWTKDMWDDYNRGSTKDREVMIAMWGEPR